MRTAIKITEAHIQPAGISITARNISIPAILIAVVEINISAIKIYMAVSEGNLSGTKRYISAAEIYIAAAARNLAVTESLLAGAFNPIFLQKNNNSMEYALFSVRLLKNQQGSLNLVSL